MTEGSEKTIEGSQDVPSKAVNPNPVHTTAQQALVPDIDIIESCINSVDTDINTKFFTASTSSVPRSNSGNPVFTCMARIDMEQNQMNWDNNYRPEHPLYKTSASLYGIFPATHESAPTTFHGKSQKFSQHLGQCGMYRNHSLNTWTDKSKVHDSPHL